MRNNKAMTLITLVITITVMLILAGVSVRIATNSGLIDRTKNTAENWNNSAALDEIHQKITQMAVESSDGSVNVADIEALINEKYSDIAVIEREDDGTAYIKFNSGYVVINNEKLDRVALSELGDWSINSNFAILKVGIECESNSYLLPISKSSKNPVVPKGFMAVNVGGANWEASKDGKSVEGYDAGLVIKDESGNQFVWVPVENMDSMFSGNSGKLSVLETYNYDGDFIEPSANGLDTSKINGYTSTLFQDEFNAMKSSIEKYGGFYIGRAASGNLANYLNSNGESKIITSQNSSYTPNKYGYTWYEAYKSCKDLRNDNYVSTHLIWGCQWDYIVKEQSGKAKKNILNMENASRQWTMTLYTGSLSRVVRGSSSSASDVSELRAPEGKNTSSNASGSRVVLIVK